MKIKLRLTALEARENPSTSPVTESGLPTAPPQPSEMTMIAQEGVTDSLGETLYVGSPVVSPPPLESDPDAYRERMIDFMIAQALEAMNRVGPPDTFVGPPLPPSMIEGPQLPVRRPVLPPLLMPGDYGIQPLPWNMMHPLWPRGTNGQPLPSNGTSPVYPPGTTSPWAPVPLMPVTTPVPAPGSTTLPAAAPVPAPGSSTLPAPATVPAPGGSN